MDTNNELYELIRIETNFYNNAKTYHEKTERLNNIIQIKGRLTANNGIIKPNELYQDVKRFLKDYTLSIDEGKYGYDSIDIEHVKKYLSYFNQKEQIALSNYFMRILYVNGYEVEYDNMVTFKKRIELDHYLHKKPYLHFLKILYLITTYNIYSIVGTVIFIIFVTSLMLLPAPEWSTPIFNIETIPLCNNIFINNLLNFIGNILSINEVFKIEPLNLNGIVVLILGKIFIIIFVINILIKEFNNKFKY